MLVFIIKVSINICINHIVNIIILVVVLVVLVVFIISSFSFISSNSIDYNITIIITTRSTSFISISFSSIISSIHIKKYYYYYFKY